MTVTTKQPTKYYVAANFSDYQTANYYADQLIAKGHEVVSTWHREGHKLQEVNNDPNSDLSAYATIDISEINSSDQLIMVNGLQSVTGGKHVEFGMALARSITNGGNPNVPLMKPPVVIGTRTNVFHWLRIIKIYALWEEFYETVPTVKRTFDVQCSIHTIDYNDPRSTKIGKTTVTVALKCHHSKMEWVFSVNVLPYQPVKNVQLQTEIRDRVYSDYLTRLQELSNCKCGNNGIEWVSHLD